MRTFFKISIVFLLVFISSCDSENGLNCTQAAGDLVRQELSVESFERVLVYERTRLLVQQGPEYKVIVETGENLLNDIDIKVQDNQLIIVNNNGCNLVRDYGITTVTVIAPNLTEIRSSTGEDTRSIGTLNYPRLTLYSEDAQEEDLYHTTGNFYLDLDVDSFRIVTNNLSNFYLTGQVNTASLEWYSGDGQLFATDLEIQNAQVYHRGTHNWQIDVKQNIAGSIVGYGDVILESSPVSVNVQETWQGRLIIKN
ncbi:head GIN domain-containing protein [Nonlabens ulvanivorans]|uniref:head GIN domain-containing protein n=1 Tax=Nonlabens ulvanivorans TaxID=906888 RepID=UPI002942833F|nr:head GIN domain-containing protein [Nonlabens ulvanivorans]WOI22707.1 head GIN domain-containing protein [Nonlabens ulvanivorans]